MRDVVPYLVVGLASGSLYGLAGLGLVLTYRTSGIFNFAHGGLAAASAALFFTLHFTWGWPWPLAALVAVGVFGPAAGFVLEPLARALAGGRQVTIVVATIGLLLLIQGLLFQGYGLQRRAFPEFLPTSTAFRITGVAVSWAQVVNVGIGVASFAGLYLFLRRSRLGLAMRATVTSPDLLALTGTTPRRVRRASWAIGCSFAAGSGILIAPTLGLDPFLLSALVVQAFGAVAIGRFTSLPLTYGGGLAIGVLASLATKYLSARPPLNGIPPVVPFLVLVVVMLATPARRLPSGAGRPDGSEASTRRRLPGADTAGVVVGGMLLLAVPRFVGPRLPVYSAALVLVVLFLSISLLTRLSGQISLCHAAFAAVGACAFSHFTVGARLPWLVALLGAALAAAPVGAVVALTASRLSGLYLALATFGFGLFMENVVYRTGVMFGTRVEGLVGPRPSFGPIRPESDTAFYYVILTVVALSAALVVALRRTRIGRILRALADSPTALATLGISLPVTRVLVFSLSAFLAGLAGALSMAQATRLGAISFNSFNSLLYLVVVVVAGAVSGFVASAFLAAGLFAVLPSYLTAITPEVQSLLFGAAVLGAALAADGRLSRLAGQASEWAGRVAAESEGRLRAGPVRDRMAGDAVRAAHLGVEGTAGVHG